MVQNVQCPVCTLYLHAGMSLSDHLETHPKEQVIKALVEFTISKGDIESSSNAALNVSIKEENEKKANNVEESIDSKKVTQTDIDATSSSSTSSYQTDSIYNRNYTQQQESPTFTHDHGQLQEKHVDEFAVAAAAAPPPPPRSPPSAMRHAYATLQTNHQQAMLTHHQLQQHQQQQIKVLPWNMLPMQPPLQQLISYQAAAHATPHQKPPPAYVTAISQIRSQHNNQTKQQQQQQQHAWKRIFEKTSRKFTIQLN